jgi:hypothetical protein
MTVWYWNTTQQAHFICWIFKLTSIFQFLYLYGKNNLDILLFFFMAWWQNLVAKIKNFFYWWACNYLSRLIYKNYDSHYIHIHVFLKQLNLDSSADKIFQKIFFYELCSPFNSPFAFDIIKLLIYFSFHFFYAQQTKLH